MENYLMYLRKSRQDSPFETVEEVLARHETILQDFARRTLGYTIPEENIYREVVSGETIEKRPEMQTILKRIEQPEVAGVFTVDAQRLSRGDLMDCGTVMTAFKYSHTKILTPSKVYDLWDKYDEKNFRNELLQGREYLEYATEVMQRGRKISQSEGWYLGSYAPFGYDRCFVQAGAKRRPSLNINEYEAEAVRMIFHWFIADKLSLNNIADKLNALGYKTRREKNFTADSVKTILSNEVYIGKIVSGKRRKNKTLVNGKVQTSSPRSKAQQIYDGKHPAIISDDIFYQAAERLANLLPRIKRGTEVRNPLVGLIKCSCGRTMCYHLSGNGKPRLECSNVKYCKARSVSFDLLMDRLVDSLQEIADDFEVKIESGADAAAEQYEKNLTKVKNALNNCEVEQERLYRFLESGTYDEDTFRKRNALLAEKRAGLKEQQEELLLNAPAPVSYEELTGTLLEVIGAMRSNTLTAKQKNDFLKTIIDKIIYTAHEPLDDGTQWGCPQFELDIFLKTPFPS